MAAEGHRMPTMAVENEYGFEGPGRVCEPASPVEGRRQLIVRRFFFSLRLT